MKKIIIVLLILVALVDLKLMAINKNLNEYIADVSIEQVNAVKEQSEINERLLSRIDELETIIERNDNEISELKSKSETKPKIENEIKVETSDPRELLTMVCETYGVDPRLAISISRLETGNWKSNIFINNNNFGGMTNGKGWYSYSTRAEGANKFVAMLKNEYIDKGLDTPKKMESKYCPSGDWATKVEEIMREE